MKNRSIHPIFCALALFVFSTALAAQTAEAQGAKKAQAAAPTPDLTGVWANITEVGPTFNAKEGPSFQPWAEAKWKANKNDDPGQPAITNGRVNLDPTVASCFPTGMPRLMTEVFPFEILQVRDRVLILFEKDYLVSHIWTDGRKLPEDPDPTYMGQSVGKWEGDTLVVDTVGLKDITWLDRQGHPHSDALHVTWRVRRITHDRLQIDWTFDDPKAFTKPWTGRTIYRHHPDWTLEEFIACEDRLLHGGESLEQKAVKEGGQ
ncbi:MAG TPA: hypothetical protein VNZ63_06310 [Verrucomicrobiae bacterium]|jgi:hypothetical protein|nr:hypothetical protein [Verrucomicrobiae bacterium]